MKNEEILKKAIEKAVKGGYKPVQKSFDYLMNFETRYKATSMSGEAIQYALKEKYHYSYIFSHDFAKAFWGDEEVCKACDGNYKVLPYGCGHHTTGCPDHIPAWQYHLKHMVLEEEPLLYLRKFL